MSRNGMTFLVAILGMALSFGLPAGAQEIAGVPGWQVMQPTSGTHRTCIDLEGVRAGKGCGKIVGNTDENNARGGFIVDYSGKAAVPAGKPYRVSLCYRTSADITRHATVMVDSYTREGEKGRKQLLQRNLEPSAEWREFTAQVEVPADAARVRMLLYLYGKGAVWYDDVFFGDTAPGSANVLSNGSFEPPLSYAYDLAPERKSGSVRFLADFPNGALGAVKQTGPDEFYIQATPQEKPHSQYLWFHFGVEGCAGREVTFHVNPAPFSQERTAGNGTRSPIVSDDGDTWTGIPGKSWNEDGSLLTFKHRFEHSPAYVASFFPFTPEHVTRFIAQHQGSPHFRAGTLGKTREGRDQRYYTLTDFTVPETEKRVLLFTTLQHDLESTGALALEGICRFLLSDDPRAARMRRAFVVYVVPVMDVDGIAGGNLYCPAGNMNRQWGLGTAPETTNVERFAKELAARGRRIDLYMDFHGWCTPERTTLLMTFGKEVADAATEADGLRLAGLIGERLTGKVHHTVWRKMVEYVTMGETDVRRMAPGWMRFEAGARLAYSIEIFGEGECEQQGYFDWGKAFAEGMAEFYGM